MLFRFMKTYCIRPVFDNSIICSKSAKMILQHFFTLILSNQLAIWTWVRNWFKKQLFLLFQIRNGQSNSQKQPPRGVPRKRCSENMQQIYRRAPLPKCNFNKVSKSTNMLNIKSRGFDHAQYWYMVGHVNQI